MAEQSLINPNDLTMRSVSSSSASVLSTPSNNIRKIQQHQPNHQQQGPRARSHHQKSLDIKSQKLKPNTRAPAIKSKLLDLQSLRKYTKPSKPTDLSLGGGRYDNLYDYLVFVDGISPELGPRIVKESQIKAWESAERITSNIIFDSDSEDEGDVAATPTRNSSPTVLESIPGYTKEEVKILSREFDTHGFTSQPLRAGPHGIEPVESYQYRQEQQLTQHSSFAGKRKQQVSNKKELISRLFGNNNNLNQDYLTNNTSYSALDNVLNIQKAFHEDKEEVKQLIECEREYYVMMQETRTKFDNEKYSVEDQLNHQKVREVVSHKLDMMYNRYLNEEFHGINHDVAYDDLNRHILNHLRNDLIDE